MRRLQTGSAIVWVVAALGLGAQGAEPPPESFRAAMKELASASASMRAHMKEIESAGAYPDYTGVDKDAAALKAAFSVTLAYWKEKKAPDAVASAETGLEGVAMLEKAVADKSYDALLTASTTIGGTCAACHKAHREQLPDGSYAIK